MEFNCRNRSHLRFEYFRAPSSIAKITLQLGSIFPWESSASDHSLLRCIKDPLCDTVASENPGLASSVPAVKTHFRFSSFYCIPSSSQKHNTVRSGMMGRWQTERKWGEIWTQTHNFTITRHMLTKPQLTRDAAARISAQSTTRKTARSNSYLYCYPKLLLLLI